MGRLYAVLLSVAVLAPSVALANIITPSEFTVDYSFVSRMEVYGADSTQVGSTVAFNGFGGSQNLPANTFFVIDDIPVGTLSITTHLPGTLPIGFTYFDFPLSFTVNGITRTLDNRLMLTIDHSNHGATLLFGTTASPFVLDNGMQMLFQTKTVQTGAANDGLTTSATVLGQIWSAPSSASVPEPSTFALVALGLLLTMATRLRVQRPII